MQNHAATPVKRSRTPVRHTVRMSLWNSVQVYALAGQTDEVAMHGRFNEFDSDYKTRRQDNGRNRTS